MLIADPAQRRDLWSAVAAAIEQYLGTERFRRLYPEVQPGEVRGVLSSLDLEVARDPVAVVDLVVDLMTRGQTHASNPRYFGLFVPPPSTPGIAADALVAAFNPQVATWAHSPCGTEVEDWLVERFGQQLGYAPGSTEGAFTSGASEATLTALVSALASHYPRWATDGLPSHFRRPILYTSVEAHHSLEKAARITGLGSRSIRRLPVDRRWRLEPEALLGAIRSDRAAGYEPLMVVATAGTTAAGAIDPLRRICEIARRSRLWAHVDAAWGGAAVLLPHLRDQVAGIELADSIGIDAHKWLAVPFSAGLYLTRRAGTLESVFSVEPRYMPDEVPGQPVDFLHRSAIWSRRFVGLRLLMSLATFGWSGYRAAIRHQVRMGDRLRRALEEDGWRILNDTSLPLVCFDGGDDGPPPAALVAEIRRRGKVWISTACLDGRFPVVRACVTHPNTLPGDLDLLVSELAAVRRCLGAEQRSGSS